MARRADAICLCEDDGETQHQFGSTCTTFLITAASVLLIKRGASLNITATDAEGLHTSPLFEVVRSDNKTKYPDARKQMDLIKYMIKKGASIDENVGKGGRALRNSALER